MNTRTFPHPPPPVRLAICVISLIASVSDSCGEDIGLRPFRRFQCNEKTVFCAAVDSSQRLVATGGGDNQVSLWDLQTSKRVRQWQPTQAAVIDLAFQPQTHLVASASYPKQLTLYDTKADEQVWQVECLAAPTRVAFSRDGTKIAVGFFSGNAAVHDAKTGQLICAINEECANSNAVAFSADGRSIVVAANSRRRDPGVAKLNLHDANSGKRIRTLCDHAIQIQRARVSPDGTRVASLDRSGLCRITDLQTGDSVQQWKLDTEPAASLQFLDDDTVAVGCQASFAILRVGNDNPTNVESAGGVNHLVVLPDRGILGVAVFKDFRLYLFDRDRLRQSKPVAAIAQSGPPSGSASELSEGANEPPEGIRFDGLVGRDELESLLGKPLAIKMISGRFVVKVTLDTLQFDRKQHGLEFIKYGEENGRTKSVRIEDVYAFWVGNERFHLRYFPPTKQLFLINSQVADSLAESRLAATNNQIRERKTEDEQSEATAEHLKFLQDAAETLKDVAPFQIAETESTLIFTDYPPQMTGNLRVAVDQLNAQLNSMFGIPAGQSVWRGKAIVAVFSSVQRFAAFEQEVMNNPNHGGVAGVRSGRRRFLQTVIAKKIDKGILRGLAWGYSLGFASRLHSDARGAAWMNQGISNVVPATLFPDQRRQRSQRTNVARQLQNTRSLLGILDATDLDRERRPTCGEMVQFLINADPIAFSQMFRDVKLGVPMEEALQQNFALSTEELALRFGNSMGVAGVTK